MSWFADLAPLTVFGGDVSTSLRAVGWLAADLPYSTGRVDRLVFEKLSELLSDAWEPFASAGVHPCELCQFKPEKSSVRNLFVPGKGVIYVCPELILHYINAHRYCPPVQFCEAVLACTDTKSMDYKKSLLANGGRELLQAKNRTRLG